MPRTWTRRLRTESSTVVPPTSSGGSAHPARALAFSATRWCRRAICQNPSRTHVAATTSARPAPRRSRPRGRTLPPSPFPFSVLFQLRVERHLDVPLQRTRHRTAVLGRLGRFLKRGLVDPWDLATHLEIHG